jgi:hypothetical protein
MPIIATRASAAYGAGFGAITTVPYLGPFDAYVALASVRLTASLAEIVFSSIPTDYQHLQIRMTALSTTSNVQPHMRLNGDATASYSRHNYYSTGSSSAVYGAASVNQFTIGGLSVGMNTTDPYTCVIDIFDFASSTKNKTMTSLSGTDRNGTGEIGFHTGVWVNTAPITSVTILADGNSYAANSTFALYGVK